MVVVLVTGGRSQLAQAVATQLAAHGHAVRLTDRPAGGPAPAVASETPEITWVECSLDANEDTDKLVKGVTQIIHVEPALPALEDWIDTCARCVYNLLWAASAAAVERCCILSTMDIFDPYPTNVGVKFNFQPLPSTQPEVLGPWLAEFAAREFAMCGALVVVSARLGTLLDDPPTAAEIQAGQYRWWVTVAEVAEELTEAVDAAEAAGLPPLTSRHASIYDTVNLCHGDGLRPGLSKQRADGGNPLWSPPPPLRSVSRQPASDCPSNCDTRVLILGASGMLGPDIVRCLSGDLPEHGGDESCEYNLKITDVTDRPKRRDDAQIERSNDNNQSSAAFTPQTPETDPRHVYKSVDITNVAEVSEAAVDTDVIIVCAVSRTPVDERRLAFDVNARGVFNAATAAVRCGHERLINTGPWTVVGGHYRNWHHNLNEDMPPQSGLDLYSFSKGIGHEISRVFSANHPLHVLTTMHGSFPRGDFDEEYPQSAEVLEGDYPFQPLSSTFADAAR
jgi:nucleoside-diphosphate-sugar epimerase